MSPLPGGKSVSVKIGEIELGGGKDLVVIAGPCVIESWETIFNTATYLKELSEKLGFSLIFKASFDKANRTSIHSFRGPGLTEGLSMLSDIKSKLNLPVLSDIHESSQCKEAGRVLDVLQIPAFLCRQTDLLVAAAETGRVVNVKKGQFVAPTDMQNVVSKIVECGNNNAVLTERGTTFGYNNLVVDLRSIPIMQSFGVPVIFDATHSVQLPGGGGTVSSGQRQYIPTLARAAVAAGCDGVFMECHPNPDEAKSDGPNQVPLTHVRALIEQLLAVHKLARSLPDLELPQAGQCTAYDFKSSESLDAAAGACGAAYR
ncbi:MAG: 3-deoxy-8-phosphooctulonate synthase [Candidatus Melainabacteria bacterium]|nr:3-deoxy-8-phosphooctulonate synthase [Candidatus Melainabacteria bacterium]